MESVYSAPLFGVAITVIAYAISSAIHHRIRWLPTLVLTCGSLIALLLVCNISYGDYDVGGKIISFFLGPATIATWACHFTSTPGRFVRIALRCSPRSRRGRRAESQITEDW